MSVFIVNKYTPLVPVQTKGLQGGVAIVYLSTISEIGHIVTVRDMDGFLSTPQAILVSTTGQAFFATGETTMRIEQRFGYITFRSFTENIWKVVDQNAFSTASASYSIGGLTFSSLSVNDSANIRDYVSSAGQARGAHASVRSTLEIHAPLFVSTLGVNIATTGTPFVFRTSDSLLCQGNVLIQSSMSTVGRINIFSTVNTVGPFQAAGNVTVSGELIHSSPTSAISIGNRLSTGYRVISQLGMSTGGFTTIATSAQINRNLFTSTLITHQTQGNFITANAVQFGPQNVHRVRYDITVIDPLYTSTTTPVLEVQPGLATTGFETLLFNTDFATTPNLFVSTSIISPNISSVQFGVANIQNPNGVITVSAVTVQQIQYQTLFGEGGATQFKLMVAGLSYSSSISLQYLLQSQNSVEFSEAIISSVANFYTQTSSLLIGGAQLRSDSMTISTIFVSSGMVASGLSSIVIPNSLLWNPNGQIQTSTLFTSSTRLSNTILQVNTLRTSNAQFTISGPSISASAVGVSSTVTYITLTSTLSAVKMILGNPLNFSTISPTGPYLWTSTVSGVSTNGPYEYISGLGTTYNPLQAVAIQDRVTRIFLGNISTNSTAYITANFTYKTTITGTGTAGLRLGNPSGQSTLISFTPTAANSTIQTASLVNYRVDRNFLSVPNYLYISSLRSYTGESAAVHPQILAGGINGPINYSYNHGETWTTVDASIFAFSLYGFVWGGTKWLAFGNGSTDTIAYSYDGVTWYGLGKSIFDGVGFGGAFGGVLWIAGGSGATNTLAYSYDGLTWTGLGKTIFDIYARNVGWSGTRWVAVGAGGTNTLAYSNNGTTWVGLGKSIFTNNGIGVAYGGGIWVAIGSGTNTVAYSADGINWTGLGTTVFQFGGYDVVWNGSLWIVAGNDPTYKLAYSTDGMAWTQVNVNSIFTTVESVGWSGLYFIAGGALVGGTGGGTARSTDGINWSAPSGTLNSLVINSAQGRILLPVGTPYATFANVIAVGSSSTNLMAASADGINFSGVTVPFTQKVNCVAWNGVYWVAGGEGTYQLAYSTDGINWTGVTLPNITAVYCIAWVQNPGTGVGQWVAGGNTLATKGWASSTNSTSWTEQTAIFDAATYAFVHANNFVYAVGANSGGGIAFSPDLSTWYYHSTLRPSNIIFSTAISIAFNGRAFVVVGSPLNYFNTIAYGDYEGIYWTGLGNTIFSVQGNDVAYGNGVWVAVGEGTNTIAISKNGVAWTGLGLSVFSLKGTGVTWNGTRFVATGSGTNTLAYSPDGLTWTGNGAAIFPVATYLGSPGQGTKVAAKFVGEQTFPNSDFPVTFYKQNTPDVVALTPKTIQKLPNSVPGWNARINSIDGFADTAYLSFRPSMIWADAIMGLSDNPTFTSSFTRINYGISLTSDTNVQIYENGIYINNYGNYTQSDQFKIFYNGNRVYYYQNANLLRSVVRTPGSTLHMCCSLNTPGAKITDIDFHRPYSLITANPAFSTVNFIQSGETGVNIDLFPPIYYNSGNLGVSQFNLDMAIAGDLPANVSSSVYANMYINETLYLSTAAQPAYFNTLSTYQFIFFVPSRVTLTSNDRVNFRVGGTKSSGQLYMYGNWIDSVAVSTISSVVTNLLANPNGMEYLEFFHDTGNTGFQTSEMQLDISPVSTLTTNYTDSNYGIELNRGFLRWSSTLNATTIDNKFNDTSTRSVTYANGLFYASDPAVKRSIEDVDLEEMAGTFSSLRLRKYAFITPYLSTFLLDDASQLGLITTEVEPIVPHVIKEAPFPFCGLSTIDTIDRSQIRFIHLGATKALMERVSTLEQRIQNHLRCLYPLVEGRSNV